MTSALHSRNTQACPPARSPGISLRKAAVLLAGLGTLGSHLAQFLAPLVGRLVLADRDFVTQRNLCNQALTGIDMVGMPKVQAVAELLRRQELPVKVEVVESDVRDLPLGLLAGVDLVMTGLDSLLARQAIISERCLPLGIPVIDGAVGEPLLGCVKVLQPAAGNACLECNWSEDHYRQLANETPCIPDGVERTSPTPAPAFLGSHVASVMTAQALGLFEPDGLSCSYVIDINLKTTQSVLSKLKQSASCRNSHRIVEKRIALQLPFEQATASDLLQLLRREFPASVQLQLRRGLIKSELYAATRFVTAEHLKQHAGQRLAELGFLPHDGVVASNGHRSMLFLLAS